MSISFRTIPPGLKVPLFYAEFDNSRAGVAMAAKRALIIGQAIGAGGVAAPRPQWIGSPQLAAAAFGADFILAAQVAAYRANDPTTELWALAFSDAPASVAAAGSFTLTGTATAPGVIPLRIGGVSVPVAVATGDTANVAANKVLAVVNASAACPVSAAVPGGTGAVNLTAVNKGLLGNTIPISVAYYGARGGEAMPAGLTYAIVAMVNGAGDPDLTGIAASIAAMDFDFIVSPYTGGASLAATTAMMNDSAGRWSYLAGKYGHVFSAKQDTAVNLIAFGNTLNDPHLSVLGTHGSPTPDYVWAAAFAGAVAPSIQGDAARPVQTLPILGVLGPPEPSLFAWGDNNSLLSNGIGVAATAQDGSVSILRAVTTYQKDAYGQANQSYLDYETMATLAEITRRLEKAATITKFARSKLADDGTRFGPGQPVVTPSIFRAEIIAQYRQMEYDGLVEDATSMARATVVQRNGQDPSRLDVLWAPYLVSGLRIVALLNQFRLISDQMQAASVSPSQLAA